MVGVIPASAEQALPPCSYELKQENSCQSGWELTDSESRNLSRLEVPHHGGSTTATRPLLGGVRRGPKQSISACFECQAETRAGVHAPHAGGPAANGPAARQAKACATARKNARLRAIQAFSVRQADAAAYLSGPAGRGIAAPKAPC